MRFRNPALPHRTQQIAMDGSQKLPQRLLGTVRDRLAGGASIRHLALAVAGWIRYASGADEQGRPIAVSDPLADEFRRIVAAGRAMRRHRFADSSTCAPCLATWSRMRRFAPAVTRNVVALFRDGVRRTLDEHLTKG